DTGDGGGTADAEAAADEHGEVLVDLEHPGQAEPGDDADRDDDGGEDEDEPAETEDVTEHDLRAERDDAQPQQRFGREVESGGEGLGQIRNEVAEEDAQDDRDQKR